jgi:hypothetical protein
MPQTGGRATLGARHAHADADASHSGIHTGGEECAMPSWLHSEWRLLHAYVPACSGPVALLPRNRSPGSLHKGLHLLRSELAIFVGVHSFEDPLVSRLKFLQ